MIPTEDRSLSEIAKKQNQLTQNSVCCPPSTILTTSQSLPLADLITTSNLGSNLSPLPANTPLTSSFTPLQTLETQETTHTSLLPTQTQINPPASSQPLRQSSPHSRPRVLSDSHPTMEDVIRASVLKQSLSSSGFVDSPNFGDMNYSHLDVYLEMRIKELDIKKAIFDRNLERLNEIDFRLVEDDGKLSQIESNLSQIEESVISLNSEIDYVTRTRAVVDSMLSALEVHFENTLMLPQGTTMSKMMEEVESRLGQYAKEVVTVEDQLREDEDSMEFSARTVFGSLIRSMDWIESSIVATETKISHCFRVLNRACL